MSKNYDNWERLVAAVLRREHDRQIAFSESRDSSAITSRSSSSLSLFHDQLPAASFEALNYFNRERSSLMDYQETRSRPSPLREFLDVRTGMVCYIVGGGSIRQNWRLIFNAASRMVCQMVGARDLNISSGDGSKNWKWRFNADSRLSEVAVLHPTWRLHIGAQIKARLLQPYFVYAAYLVFKTGERAKGLEPAMAVIRFVEDESATGAFWRARTVGLNAVDRGDGWMEIKMGYFYISQWDDGDVEVQLVKMRWVSGIILQGIVFRPTYTYTRAETVVSKQYQSTTLWDK